jgi:hypothetical protein
MRVTDRRRRAQRRAVLAVERPARGEMLLVAFGIQSLLALPPVLKPDLHLPLVDAESRGELLSRRDPRVRIEQEC